MIVPAWLGQLSRFFADKQQTLFVVGGALRDQLLDRPLTEWDLATAAKPEQIENLLREFGCIRIGTIGARFGTVTAVFQGETIEVTTFRGETYQPSSRQPTVQFSKTIQEDLSRRDFTINAMAYDLTKNQLLDPYDGQNDLEKKIIRAVGEADERFSEDPLRMLRAIRFMSTLNFEIEPTTFEAISRQKERFAILSAERIAQELDKILLGEKPSRGWQAIVETGLVNYVLPELIPSIDLEFDARDHKDIYSHILQVLDQSPPKLALRWCALLHDIAKPLTRKKIAGQYHFLGHENLGGRIAVTVLRRLKYPNDFVNYVAKLVRLHQRIPNDDGQWTDGALRRFVRDAGETLSDLFDFAEADSTGKNELKLAKYRAGRQKLRDRITKLEAEAEIAKIKSPLSGEELMVIFKRPAGAWIRPIKEQLLAQVLDGQLKPDDKLGAEKIAREIVRSLNSKP